MTSPSGPRGSPAVDLYWLPLGAGGHFVRLNGRAYERIVARREGRTPLDLYHTALEVIVPDGRFVIESSWPIPREDPARRGVVVRGPVGVPRLGRFRIFRYEIRCWRDGSIPDIAEAVGSPQALSRDERLARRLLELTSEVPPFAWGRDVLGIGDMWNSNSVISWLLERSGVGAHAGRPPAGGRAPGWRTGIAVAANASRRSLPSAPSRPTLPV